MFVPRDSGKHGKVAPEWYGDCTGLRRIDAELSAEPMPFGYERIVDSGVRRLITRSK
jgi:hypothetical protein